ncbi:MAG: hypothetical protein IPI12_14565 [Ignavibacteriales bacterium]|jgi:hypothetical protein|nr:hypothetical protein [Ignavibacteriales bacterium]MBK7267522.1 hypothetical protein [Ignavibacteriales bacterium]MBK8664178.1 hypothetical protein [Ignavibacteriales bacterium]MBP7542005.1 hypothetical protein [Ignavibacteriaceae bacterium]MCC6636896.1 hypothetical protein [Ignavibacteriaceae bacterium]
MFEFSELPAKEPKKREYEESEELKFLAEKIISEQKIDVMPAQVGYMIVSPNISKTVPSKTIKTPPELKHFSGFDYLVEVSLDLWTALDEAERYILIHHELLHILPIMNEKTGDYDFKIRKPDFVAFKSILDKYGTDWKQKIKLSLSSIHNLTPAQEDSIRI